jgi:hypothetical protein
VSTLNLDGAVWLRDAVGDINDSDVIEDKQR